MSTEGMPHAARAALLASVMSLCSVASFSSPCPQAECGGIDATLCPDLQAALDMADWCLGFDTVLLPAEHYVVHTTLLVGSDVAVIGAGMGSTVIEHSDRSEVVVANREISWNPDDPTGPYPPNRGIRLSRVTLRGRVVFKYVEDLTISGCEFAETYGEQFRKNGLVIGIGCHRVTVRDSVASNNYGIGFYVGNARPDACTGCRGGQVRFDGCVAEGNLFHGFAAFDSYDVSYTGCSAHGNGSERVLKAAGFNIDKSRAVSYDGCLAVNNEYGFASYSSMRDEEELYPASLLSYTGCIAESNGYDRSGTSYGGATGHGFLLSSSEHITMVGCHSRLNRKSGITLSTGHVDAVNPNDPEPPYYPQRYAKQFTVTGGLVAANGTEGIVVAGARHGTISGVTVLNNGTTGIELRTAAAHLGGTQTTTVDIPSHQITVTRCQLKNDPTAQPTWPHQNLGLSAENQGDGLDHYVILGNMVQGIDCVAGCYADHNIDVAAR